MKDKEKLRSYFRSEETKKEIKTKCDVESLTDYGNRKKEHD
jgi:hypothetical protein